MLRPVRGLGGVAVAHARDDGTSTKCSRCRPMTTSSPSASVLHSTRSPLTNTPLRLRSSSTRSPSGWRTISAWRRDTVGSSKRMSAARLRPIRVHSRASAYATTSSLGPVGEVLAGSVRALADLVEPGAIVDLGREIGDHTGLRGGEQRCAHELGPAAVGARRQLVDGVQRHWVIAIRATEGSGPRNIARRPSFHRGTLSFNALRAGKLAATSNLPKPIISRASNAEQTIS